MRIDARTPDANVGVRLGLAAVVLATVLSAQTTADARAHVRFRKPVVAIKHCHAKDPTGASYSSPCAEPSVAVDPRGRIFVTWQVGGDLAVSTDGGRTFVARPAPPPPLGAEGGVVADAIVQIDPRGRLVFSNIYGTGIQLAISSTAGRSWDLNTVVGASPVATAPLPDRQWVGFGPRREIYVIWRTEEDAYWTATSTDDGRTFAPPEPFLPGDNIVHTGPPVVDAAGRVYVPVVTDSSPIDGLGPQLSPPNISVGLAVSPSGVSTTSFSLHTVAQVAVAELFPIAAIDRAGRIAVAWWGEDDTGRVASMSESLDGGRSWSPVRTWGPAPATSSPWVSVRNGRIDVLSYQLTLDGQEANLVLARGTNPSAPADEAVVESSIPFYRTWPANTDYAHFALTPDGRVVAVWAVWGDNTIKVAVEKNGVHA